MGNHGKTLSQLEGVKQNLRDVSSECDQLRQSVKSLQEENEKIRKLHPIFDFYGPEVKIMASYDLRKEIGSRLTVGKCPDSPCLSITLRNIKTENNSTSVEFSVARLFGDSRIGPQGLGVSMPLKRGCSAEFTSRFYDWKVVIEEDRVTDLRLGIGVSLSTSDVGHSGILLKRIGCPQ